MVRTSLTGRLFGCILTESRSGGFGSSGKMGEAIIRGDLEALPVNECDVEWGGVTGVWVPYPPAEITCRV